MAAELVSMSCVWGHRAGGHGGWAGSRRAARPVDGELKVQGRAYKGHMGQLSPQGTISVSLFFTLPSKNVFLSRYGAS